MGINTNKTTRENQEKPILSRKRTAIKIPERKSKIRLKREKALMIIKNSFQALGK